MFSTKSLVHFTSFFLLLALILAPVSPAHAAGIRYAAPSAVGSGDCSSWANACTLQTALAGAASGDEIWVKMGVHYPGTNQTDTFTLKTGVAVYGGFAGTETALTQRNWQTNKTILSGDIDQNDNHGGDYINENASQIVGNNAYHVVRSNGLNNTAVLDGFIITAGQANSSSYPDYYGGGMYNTSSSPTLTNVTFSGNSATQQGGGMLNDNSSPTMTNVTFSGNSAPNGGGGMYNYSSSNPTLTNVTFSGNSANYGGGMYNWSSNPTLTNVTFSGNSAPYGGGGGMYNYQSSSSSTTLTNVTFSGNSAPYGGGMDNYQSNPTLTNVTFSGNSATNDGGGMYNDTSNPTLKNVTFSGNSATNGGGMLNSSSSSPTLTNVTFSGNTASNYGGGMLNSSSSPTLTNVIMWGDSATTSGPEIYDYISTPVVTYSDIQGGYAGTGNINADPLFVDANGPDDVVGTADDNLRLGFGSPAIDSGTNTGCPATDLDGLSRPADGNGDSTAACDMGAYEAGQMFCSVAVNTAYTFDKNSSVVITTTATLGNLSCLYVDEMELNHPNATAGLQTGRYWLIRGLQSDKVTDATGFSSVNLTLPTTFTPDDKDKLCRYNGAVWDCAMSSFTTNTITRNGVTAFSDWTVGNNVGPTAVMLASLSAHAALPAVLPLLGAAALLLLAGWGRRRSRKTLP